DVIVAGPNRARKIVLDIRRRLGALGKDRIGIASRKLGQKLAATVAHAVGVHQKHELLRREPYRDLGRDLFQRQVENLARRRITEWRDKHDIAVIEPLPYGFDIDAANLAGPQHIDTVEDAHRLGGKEIAADH